MDATITATAVFSDWDGEQETLRGDIVQEAARMVLQEERVKEKIEGQILDQVDDRVNALLSDLFDREIQPTDSWGHSTGSPIRITALLQRDAEAWLTEKVDRSGYTSSGSYDRSRTRLAHLVQELYEKDFKGFFQNAVKEGIDSVKERIGEQIDADIKEYLRNIASTI